MKRTVKNFFIYMVVRLLWLKVALMPPFIGRVFARILGCIAYKFAKKEREIATKQLCEVLGLKKDSRRLKKIVKGVFLRLADSVVLLCRLSLFPNAKCNVVLPAKSKEVLTRALEEKKGVIYVTGHIGNWELMAKTLAQSGFPIWTVAKKSYDPRFTKLIDKVRKKWGVRSIFINTRNAGVLYLKVLKKGEILGMLIDQDTDIPGHFVPFFGKDALTPSGPAILARHLDCAVVTGTIHVTSGRQHIINIERINLIDDEKEFTALLSSKLEEAIRRHPTQWVWFHERWKTKK